MPTLPIPAKATIGVGKPQADSECNERIPPDGFDMAALEVALRGAMWAIPLPISREALVYLQSPQK